MTRKETQVNVKYTAIEREKLEKMMDDLGFETISDCVRAIIRKAIKNHEHEKELEAKWNTEK